eukprot:CAMPEP_0194530502 /NCGR_PEP_ID=MMETSP0253-20130528/67484_1 /TAXON_ID=2966 /ORGANISM="Noctiluca scintillans" /LENGTH=171 /DNA_ID=CAMNT_0039375747 /DNA_START=366 /DNA_END=879 /DNA_ORIENTATION=-
MIASPCVTQVKGGTSATSIKLSAASQCTWGLSLPSHEHPQRRARRTSRTLHSTTPARRKYTCCNHARAANSKRWMSRPHGKTAKRTARAIGRGCVQQATATRAFVEALCPLLEVSLAPARANDSTQRLNTILEFAGELPFVSKRAQLEEGVVSSRIKSLSLSNFPVSAGAW